MNRTEVNSVNRMGLNWKKLIVPGFLDSERITADLGLVGILRLCHKSPRPEASKCDSSSKVKVKSCGLPLDIYSLWRRVRGCYVKEVSRSVDQAFSRG